MALKEKNGQENGYEASQQKLIFSGKVLSDDKAIESYGIKEKDFIICMISNANKSTGSTSSSVAEPSTPANNPPVPSTDAPNKSTASNAAAATEQQQTPISSSNTESASGNFNDPSAFATGSQRDVAINNMIEMGYEKDQVEAAMRAAFNNPDRAVEYLLTGIPESLQQQPQPQAEQQQQQPQTQQGTNNNDGDEDMDDNVNLFEAAAQSGGGNRSRSGGGEAGGAGAAGSELGDLSFLRNNPQFQQMRELIRQQPQMIEPIIQQLATANPQLAQLISSNPEAFTNLLRGDGEEGGELGEGEEEEEGQQVPPGATRIEVTQEESDAIDRLTALGFERDIVIQAYFACDKNEEIAANYLFEHGNED